MDYSQITELIRAAGRAGVKDLDYKGLKVSFYPNQGQWTDESMAYDPNHLTDTKQDPHNSPRSVPLDTSRKELNDLTLEEKELIRELQQSQLMLTDPEKFEDMVETE
jgi:hypothetical protein